MDKVIMHNNLHLLQLIETKLLSDALNVNLDLNQQYQIILIMGKNINYNSWCLLVLQLQIVSHLSGLMHVVNVHQDMLINMIIKKEFNLIIVLL